MTAWKASDAVAVSWEQRFGDAAADRFDADKREVLALLTEEKASALARKATVDWTAYLLRIQDYLDMAGADGWREAFLPLLQGVITDQGQRITTDFGLEFDVRNLWAEKWFEDYQLTFSQPINQTSSDQLSTLLQQAKREGWSIDTTRNRIESVFRQWAEGDLTAEDFDWLETRMPAYRREAIARTETVRASAAGSQAIYRHAGVRQNEWLATKDARTRESHSAADGQVRPVGEPFDVGGYQMLYPVDGSLGAPVDELVNCRCSLLPVVEA